MAGGLILIRDRLRQVERVVMGIDNPADILCRANEADASEEGPGVYRVWSADEEVERRLADYRGAKNRSDWEKRQRDNSVIVLKGPDGRKKPEEGE